MTTVKQTMKRISPQDLYAQTGIEVEPPVLNPEQKQQLAEAAVPFDIVAVKSGLLGDNGEFWQFTCHADKYTFRLNMSDPMSDNKPAHVRESVGGEYRALESMTQEGNIVGPYILSRIEWRGGNPFYKLEAANPTNFLAEANQEALPFS